MTTAPAAVVRPARQVAALRANAERAAAHAAAQSGREPSTFIAGAIDWALGRGGAAPFTGTPTPGGATPGDVAAELGACRRYLRTTPYSDAKAGLISRARHVLSLLEWLTGASDQPPVYAGGTEPGDITGGRGPVIRDPAGIAAMAALARTRRDTGTDPEGWASGPGWYDGVTAALEWVGGQRADPPMSHPDTRGMCRHPASAGLPAPREIIRERGQAEEHLEGGYRHGDHSPGYADGVLAAFRWLYGQTTTPPAR